MTDNEAGFDYRELDDVIHSQPRLGIMSILVVIKEAQFVYLKERLGMTDGNLGTHLRKLEDSGYISVEKSFVERKPRTCYTITKKGRRAFEIYLKQLGKLIEGTEP